MQTVQLVSFVVPKLQNLVDLEKILHDYCSKWGSVEITDSTDDHIQFKLLIKNHKNFKNWDKRLYKNPIEIAICHHGFLCFKTIMDDDAHKKLKKYVLHFFLDIEKNLKRINGIEDSVIPLTIPNESRFTSGTLHTNVNTEDSFSSHLAKRIKFWNERILEAKNASETGDFKSRIHWIEILDNYEKYISAYLYKLKFAPPDCTILPKQFTFMKAQISEILHDVEDAKLGSIEKLGGIQKITRAELQTFHFIYMDIEKFSDEGIKIQEKWILNLNKIIKDWFIKKEIPSSDYFIIPTGDGMVIGFAKSPVNPFILANEIQTQLNNKKPKVRIGLASGLVIAFNNIKDQIDYIGPGIIEANRVMSFGEGGHILTSASFGDQIKKLDPSLKGLFKELKGSYVVRGSNTIRLYNVIGKKFGNKKTPKHKILKS